VICFFGGFALITPELSKWLMRWPSERGPDLTEFFFTTAIVTAGITFFVHLVAWLSLRVKFGALPLAMVISFVGMQMAGIAFAFILNSDISGEATASLILIFLLLAAAGLHATLARRLEQLAAEG
jgi:hypothetical protein